jgi:transposase-like protein
MMLVKELLEAGYTVRDVCSELGVKKTLVEKVSKKLRQETASNPRAKYLEKPFADKLREMEAAEGEDSLLSGNWLTQTYQRLAKMRVEFSMMKKMGLIEDDGGSASSQRIDINSILIAKALGNNGGNKELIELIAAFKQIGVLGTPQTDNFMEKYAAMENIKDAAVQKNTQITTAAYSAAKSESDKNFAKELVGKAIETFSPVLKNIATKPVNIPSPTPEGIPGPLMPPSQSELESLSLNLPSLQHVPVAEPAETWPVARTVQGGVPVEDTIGYTNINRPQDFGKKTQLR